MHKKPSPQAEALAQKLQEKLQRERPRWLRWVPLLALVLLGVLVLLVWVFYPTPDPPRLAVSAMDVLAVEGEPAMARAFLDPEEADSKAAPPAGLEYLFELAKPGLNEPQRRKAVSDQQGQLVAKFDAVANAKNELHVRPLTARKKQDFPDKAHLHAIAKDTPLLLVDAEETLADLEPDLWTKTNALNVAVRPGAVEALQAIHAKHKYAVAYLAIGIAPAKEYRRIRGWVHLKTMGGLALPDGPVLGRLSYNAGSTGDARKAVLEDIRKRFTGPIVAVVRSAEAAEQCTALGMRAIAMGAGDFPAPVVQIKGWQDLPAALAK